MLQALLLFANRPDNPQRAHERRKRKEISDKQKQDADRLAKDQKEWIRKMRELEEMGGHTALMRMNRYMRR